MAVKRPPARRPPSSSATDAAREGFPTATPWVPPSRSLKTLRAAATECKGCDLYARATQVVFGAGPRQARLVLIGEQPGDREDIEGAPFVGPAGGVLRRALADVGLDPDEVYVTNAVKHFSWEPRGKRRLHKKPRASEIEACRPWLDAELEAVSPEIVVCLGATAAQTILGRTFRLTMHRGELMRREGAVPVVATIHPSAILRAPDHESREAAYESFVADLRLAAAALKR
jgi:DNA polymerase